MNKIEWNERFNSGIAELDAENHKLLKMVNSLIEIRNIERKNLEALSFLLSEIQDYAHRHFRNEESRMIHVGQEDFLDHKEHHLLFKRKLAFFCFDVSKQGKTNLDEFCKFLTEWVVFHVTDRDENITRIYQ